MFFFFLLFLGGDCASSPNQRPCDISGLTFSFLISLVRRTGGAGSEACDDRGSTGQVEGGGPDTTGGDAQGDAGRGEEIMTKYLKSWHSR